MKHAEITNYRAVLIDPFSIGQMSCARIRTQVARGAMDLAAPVAFMNLSDPFGPCDSSAASLQTIHNFARDIRTYQAVLAQEDN